ncbi:MAG: amidohydrolase family protein [Nitrospinota bacterium]|nr:amidohydrolase family protein [Nitrospinota bacterium]
MYDIVIKNGQVADGVTDNLYRADLVINGDKISALAPNVSEGLAKKVVDASGMVVAPGFVDVHSHSDYYLVIDPRAESKLLQGVTTDVGGNCGYSAAPMSGALRERRVKDYQSQFGIKVGWSSLEEYFETITRAGHGINYAAMLGYNTIRGSILGENDSQPDSGSMEKIKTVIADGLDQGAVGVSVGVVYPPACFATEDEFAEAIAVVGERGKVFATHIRSEGPRLTESLQEVVNVARRSGAKLQVSHLKTAGKANWGKLDRAFEILEGAMAEGMRVMADRYPYLASNTGLQVVLPDRAFDGGKEALLRRLNNGAEREAFLKDILTAHPEPEYWDTVMVSQVVNLKNRDVEGLTVTQGADLRNKTPHDFVFDLLAEEDAYVEAIFFCMNQENMDRIFHKPYVMVGSDAGARAISGPLAIGKPHPRTFGSFPAFMQKYTRESRSLSIPEAVKKSSSMAAQFFGLSGRGEITPGSFADIVIFDPGSIRDNSTYTNPIAAPSGIKSVFVNGSLAVQDGKLTNNLAGQVITR